MKIITHKQTRVFTKLIVHNIKISTILFTCLKNLLDNTSFQFHLSKNIWANYLTSSIFKSPKEIMKLPSGGMFFDPFSLYVELLGQWCLLATVCSLLWRFSSWVMLQLRSAEDYSHSFAFSWHLLWKSD